MVVWYLFGNDNGCVKQALKDYDCEVYCIGIDQNGYGVNLADYSFMFGDDKLYNKLCDYPTPDIIFASPPCESWSVASGMKGGNSAYIWKEIDMLAIRPFESYKERFDNYDTYIRTMYTRINGELCLLNTFRIIDMFKPTYYFIENPKSGRMSYFIEKYLDKDVYRNECTYFSYDDDFTLKPTYIFSNIELNLKVDKPDGRGSLLDRTNTGNRYLYRSRVPHGLIQDIYEQAVDKQFD